MNGDITNALGLTHTAVDASAVRRNASFSAVWRNAGKTNTYTDVPYAGPMYIRANGFASIYHFNRPAINVVSGVPQASKYSVLLGIFRDALANRATGGQNGIG